MTLWPLAALLTAAPPFESALPDDCVAVLLVRDVPGLAARGGGHPLAKAFAGAAGETAADLRKRYGQLSERLALDHGADLPALLAAARGQAAFALRLAEDGGEETLALLELGDRAAAFQAALEKLSAKFAENGTARRSADGAIGILDFKQRDARGEPVRLCHAVAGNVWAAADSPAGVQRLLRGLEGKLAAPLAGNPKLQRLRQGFAANAPGLRDAEAFVLDPAAWAARSVRRQPLPPGVRLPNGGLQINAGALLNAPVSASQTSAYGFAAQLPADRPAALQFAAVAEPETLAEAFALVPRRPLAPQRWLPGNARRYVTATLDPDEAHAALDKALDALGPGTLGRVEERLREFPNPSNPLITSIKGDLIEPLGERITLVGDDGLYQGAEIPRWLIAVELRDPQKYAGLLEGLYGQFGLIAGVTRKQVRGHNVYALPPQPRRPPPPAVRGRPAAAPAFELGAVAAAVAGKQLFLATHVELLDRALNAEDEPGLVEAGGPGRALALLPPEANALMYFRGDEAAKFGWEYAKAGTWLPPVASLLRDYGPPGRAGVDFLQRFRADLMPKFDDVRKRFRGHAAGFLYVEEDLVRGAAFLTP